MPHVAIVHGAAWLPLVVWSLEELRRGSSRAWLAALAGGVACCFLAGHVQIFVISLDHAVRIRTGEEGTDAI